MGACLLSCSAFSCANATSQRLHLLLLLLLLLVVYICVYVTFAADDNAIVVLTLKQLEDAVLIEFNLI